MPGTYRYFFAIFNNTSDAIFRAIKITANPEPATPTPWQPQYWNGSTWVNIGSTFQIAAAQRTRVAISFLPGVAGDFSIYLGDVASPVSSGSGMNAAVNNTNGLMIYQQYNNDAYVSEPCACDFDARSDRWAETRIDGAGTGTQTGTGAYTDVNELVQNSSTFVEFTGSGEVSTFSHAALNPGGSYSLRYVAVGGQIQQSGAAPTTGAFVIRIAGVDYPGATLISPAGGLEGRFNIWSANPATASPWTFGVGSGFNASGVEIGFKAS